MFRMDKKIKGTVKSTIKNLFRILACVCMLYSLGNVSRSESLYNNDHETETSGVLSKNIHTNNTKPKNKKRILLICGMMKTSSRDGVQRLIDQLRAKGYIVDIDVVNTTAFSEGWSGNVKRGLYTVMNKDIKVFGYNKNPSNYDAVLVTFAVWVGSIDLTIKEYLSKEHDKITNKQKLFFLIRCRSSDQDTIFNLVQGVEKQFNLKSRATSVMRSTEREKDYQSYLGKIDEFANRIDLIVSDSNM